MSNQKDDVSEGFPEVPMAGLKHGPSKRKAKSSKQFSKKVKVSTKVQKSSNQLLISEVFENCSKEANTDLFNEGDLPRDMLDEFFDFDSQTVLYTNEQATSTTKDEDDHIIINAPDEMDEFFDCDSQTVLYTKEEAVSANKEDNDPSTSDGPLKFDFDRDATPPLADFRTPQKKAKMSGLVGNKQYNNPVSQRFIALTQPSCTSLKNTKKTSASLSSANKVLRAAGVKGKCLALKTKEKPSLINKEDCVNRFKTRASDCESHSEIDAFFENKSQGDAVYTPPSTELSTSGEDYWHIKTPTSSDLRHAAACSLSQSDQTLTSVEGQMSGKFQVDSHSVATEHSMPEKKAGPCLSSPSCQPEQSIVLDDVTNSYSNSPTPISSGASSDSITSTTVVSSSEIKEGAGHY